MPAQYARKISATLAGTGNVGAFYQNGYIPCNAGQEFFFSYAVASDGTAAFGHGIRLSVKSYDGTTSVVANWNTVVGGTTGWSTITYSYVVPDGIVGIQAGVGVRGPMVAGTDNGYFTNFTWRVKNNAALYVDGSITSDHINTTSFASEGIALFGGELQSSGTPGAYVPGVAGWKISNDGSAEFNDLQVRQDMIVAGAISRVKTVSYAGTVSVTNVPASPLILASKTWTLSEFAFSAFIPIGVTAIAANPIKFTIALKVDSSSPADLKCDIQYQVSGGSWYSVGSGWRFTANTAGPFPDSRMSMYIVENVGLACQNWTGLRIAVATDDFTPNTGAAITVDTCQLIAEQLSR